MSGDFAPIDLAHEAPFDLGALQVRPSAREVEIDERTQVLEPRVMQVLVALARRRGSVVSREDLFASCWAGRTVGEDSINRSIGVIRRLAETYGAFSITTVQRVGYRLDAAGAVAGPEPPAIKPSIAVLPFANMSDDPQQEYFSDGISEDIITDLFKVSALSVVARNTAFQFKGRSLDLRQLAGQLGVGHILEGSVRKAGGRVRITAQLIAGANGEHIWAERWDRTLDDIFALQDEISEAIVKALKLKLLPEEKAAIERRGTDNVEAYNLFLMARSYWLAGNDGDPRHQEAMERLCRRAVDLDPGYAQAWALLAVGQSILHRDHGRPGDSGRAALDRALALNPDLAEARSLRAKMLCDAGLNREASAEIAVALRLDPEAWEVNLRAGYISYNQGRLEDAAGYFERAALTETDVRALAMLVSCYTALGDKPAARRAARLALAAAEKAVAQERSNGYAMAVGVAALAALGETDRAKDWMNRALLVDPDNLQMRYNFACVLMNLLDDIDAALDMLGPVLERDTGELVRVAPADPDLRSLRADPRFQAMIAKAEARLVATGFAQSAGGAA